MFNQQIHGSKRSLRSVEDFTEFEQRTAYFNGDEIHAMKKGFNILDRIQVIAHGADAEHVWLPAHAQARSAGASRSGQGDARASCAARSYSRARANVPSCHPAPFYLDNLMHDLRTEDFVAESPSGPIKTFTLRGIKESPPYLHDGRCLTLEDTVEFFNLSWG